jgi:hypothetical protein
MKRLRWPAAIGAVLALNGALWIAQFGFALPKPLANYFFGRKMIRAEVILRTPDGVIHDYRIDQGRIRGKVGGNSLKLYEVTNPGSVVVVPVASNARIMINGVSSSFSALRRGMFASTFRQRNGDDPAEQVIATTR